MVVGIATGTFRLKNQQSKQQWTFALCLAFSLVQSFGCYGPRSVDPNAVRKAMDTLQSAKNSADGGDFSSAVSFLDQCIQSQVLPMDALFEAISLRAKCLIKTGDLERAKEDVDNVDQIATDMTVVYGLQYMYWKKKGDSAKAANAWREAQKINPSFRPPE